MVRLWGVLKKKQKIVEDVVVETERADLDGAREAVDKCCYKLDIPRPLWLPKHESEIEWRPSPSTASRWSSCAKRARARTRATTFPFKNNFGA